MTRTSEPLIHQAKTAAEFLAECEARRRDTSGSRPWSIVHVPTGEIVPALPEPIQTADGPVMPGLGVKYFRLKRDAQAALLRMRETLT